MKILLSIAIIFCGLLTPVDSLFGQTWTKTSVLGNNWQSVASSADGTKLGAILANNFVYTSTNSGVTWTSNGVSGVFFFDAIASSADGNKLMTLALSASPGTTLYTSTNAGVNWMSNSIPNRNLIAVASSADGNKLAAAVGATPVTTPGSVTSGPIFTSTNSGNTWQQSGASNEIWSCIASSADGTKLTAGTITTNSQGGITRGGYIYVSSDSGATWLQTSAPTDAWASVACSVDGSKLIAAGRSIYTSTDSGVTWISNNVPTSAWMGVASSADGSKLVAASQSIPIYTSTNSGITWMSNSVPNNAWTSVASSADGAKLVASAGFFGVDSGIYTSYSAPTPQLNIASSSTNFAISWIVPSTNFVLQQNSDVTTMNWAILTNSPILNLTNLQNQVILSPTNSSGFFRLIAQ